MLFCLVGTDSPSHQRSTCGITFPIWTPPKYKKLTDRDGMREQPAVGYPATGTDSFLVRADMESASLLRQSIRAAGVKLPEMLPASNDVGMPRVVILCDQSLCKVGWLKAQSGCSSRHRTASPGRCAPACWPVRRRPCYGYSAPVLPAPISAGHPEVFLRSARRSPHARPSERHA